MSRLMIVEVPSYSCEFKGIREVRELVRCGECVKANTEDCSHSYWDDDWGVWRIGYKGDDWYCADGEREGE